jgi:hypothetical protein
MALAKAKIKKTFYRNEGSLSFERVMEILMKAFSTLQRILMRHIWNVTRSKSC